jgi:FKBP-type peptidyl-prolyl cis-trans isomerase FkpA
MNVGSKAKFIIPSAIAYGERGASPVIPPFSPLVFDVELVSITPAK